MDPVEPILELVKKGERTIELTAAGWVRIIRFRHRATPMGVAYTRTRFSSPINSFRTLYASEDIETALAEIAERNGVANVREEMNSWLALWVAANFESVGSLKLADLRVQPQDYDPLLWHALFGSNHRHARRLSQMLHEQTTLDGLLYASRLTGRRCVAIYDRSITSKFVCRSPAVRLTELGEVGPMLTRIDCPELPSAIIHD